MILQHHDVASFTGHKSRLDRLEPAYFGSHGYGREELVAQWSATLLNAECGIAGPTEENSAAYLASWRDTIKADKKLIISAAAAGQPGGVPDPGDVPAGRGRA